MSEAIKIVSLELENVKRVRAVHLEPSPLGLTVIGGGNRAGKTSVLDGIAYALGGERFRPTNLQHDGGAADARLEVTLSNGLRVERKGKNSSLRVTDPSGVKAGQKLLDSFVEELALDMPKFLRMNGREKTSVLLRILGIEDQLAALDREERAAYDERTAQGRIVAAQKAHAEAMPEHHDAPEAPVSAAELVAKAQAVMVRNAERAAARANLARLIDARQTLADRTAAANRRLQELRQQVADAEDHAKRQATEHVRACEAVANAEAAPTTPDESTAAIEAAMADLEALNAKVRANLDKRKALDDAQQAVDAYEHLTAKVEEVRARRAKLLGAADLPLPGLSVVDGELVYNGKAWDCMSGADRIRAGVAIVRRLKPSCGFVLLDGLESCDLAEMHALGAWLEAEGLQAIATRVSDDGEACSIVIEDGMVAAPAETVAATPAAGDDY